MTVFTDFCIYLFLITWIKQIESTPTFFDSPFNLNSLNGTNGFAITGSNKGDSLGFSVRTVGDINGDGNDDLILGANGASPGGLTKAGIVYVLFGKKSGSRWTKQFSLKNFTRTDGFYITGVNKFDCLGSYVDTAGDINGDGISDLVLAAPGCNIDSPGTVYVLFGQKSFPFFNLSTLNGSSGFAITGLNEGDQLGKSVSTAGDLNGDGHDDLVMGAVGVSNNAGRVYVLFGKKSGWSHSFDLNTLDGSNGFTVEGLNTNHLGQFVSTAGDINGDHKFDLVLGTRYREVTLVGVAYVLFGQASGWKKDFDVSTLNGKNGFTVLLSEYNDPSASTTVSTAGDVNGDGFADLIVGACYDSGFTGVVYVLFGHAGSWEKEFDKSTLNGNNGFVIHGLQPGDAFGTAVNTAGDINGDGIDDLVMGAASSNNMAGAVYVLFGKAKGWSQEFPLKILNHPSSNGFGVNGIPEKNDSGASLGNSVSSAGDINGDGLTDLVLGAPTQKLVGTAYVIFGKNLTEKTTAPSNTQFIIIIIAGSTAGGLLVVVSVVYGIYKRCRSKRVDRNEGISLTTPLLANNMKTLTLPFTLQWINKQSLTILKLIGSGGYGNVYQGQWQGIDVAIKQLYLKTLSAALIADFERETQIMAQCQFPYIVRLYGICLEEGYTAMVMEYMPKGSLYQILHDEKELLPWNPLRWNISIDVGKGLSYLHSQKIIHRDLKSLNVLLDHQYHAKISDFGLSKIKLESNSVSTKTNIGMGTTRWRAPELFKRKAIPNEASDVYSYGMVLWEIATRQLPFMDGSDDFIVMGWIEKGEQEGIPLDCPKTFGEVIENCWKIVEMRPCAQQVLEMLLKAQPPWTSESRVYQENTWHIDPQTIVNKLPNNTIYELVDVTNKDKCKVIEFYQHHPVPGYDIASIKVIYNPNMIHQFALYLAQLQQRNNNLAFVAKWPTGRENMQDPVERKENLDWRSKVYQQFEAMATPYRDMDYPSVSLLPMWHGTKMSIIDSIFRTGYANLATTDSGFFGKGIYGTHEAEYAYRVYAKEGGALILNWTACFSAYPVIDGDMSKFRIKNDTKQNVSTGNYSNYDAHFVPVVPYHPNNPAEEFYYPTKPNEQHKYTEFVVFQSVACLPCYLVQLQPSLTKTLPLNQYPMQGEKNKSHKKEKQITDQITVKKDNQVDKGD